MFQVGLISVLVPDVFGLFLLICEAGDRVATQFDLFGQELERCAWYVLPIKLQRIYLIFLSDTQQPKKIESYGGLICSRETLKRVINNIPQDLFSGNVGICQFSNNNLIFLDYEKNNILFYDTTQI